VSALGLAGEQARADVFAGRGELPGRPRLLSYVGRWGRARRWLPADAKRVLDVGCAWGYGSVAIAARAPRDRTIVGVERDPDLLARAREAFPGLPMIDADAADLPLPDSSVDALLLLDVIEHLDRPGSVLEEAHRVLRPGGVLVVSVPHRGPTRWLDALNVYAELRRRRPSWPPLEAGVVATEGEHHRHFAAAELRSMLEPGFAVERIARTGVGLQELVHLAIIALRVPLRAPRLARALMPAHFFAYVLDDMLPTGPLGYHLAVRARSNKQDGAPEGVSAEASGEATAARAEEGPEEIERNWS
jgi:SAM-dependent methyltransferase